MPSHPKKMLIVAVLEILRRYTDEHHRLMQAPLLALLEKDYGLKVDRKSLRHNIEDLINAGYPLRYQRGWYYQHEFVREEVDLLAESVIKNLSLPAETICRLLNKIGALIPICQEPPLAGSDAKKLMLLERAAAEGKSVSFQASGTHYSRMTLLRIEREGRAVLRSAAANAEEPLPEENWQVTVQDMDSLETTVFPLCSLSDVTIE